MKSLGLDTSTVATGWVLLNDGVLVDKGTIRPVDELAKAAKITKKEATSRLRDELKKFFHITSRIREIIDRTDPDVLVVEDSFMKTNASVLRLLARLSGGPLFYWYLKHGLKRKAFLVMASSARRVVGCKGNAKKPEVIQFLKSTYGVEISDDNEADAMVLALYGYKEYRDRSKNV